MLRVGGIHGNLYAVKGPALAQLKARRFRMPLGLYRTDALIGAVLCFNLDPSANEWSTHRIRVCEDASWAIDPLRWWRPSDLTTQWRRMLRQAQGELENRAIRQFFAIDRRRPEDLPGFADQLILDWATRFPDHAKRLFLRQPLCYVAFKSTVKRWRNSGPQRMAVPDTVQVSLVSHE